MSSPPSWTLYGARGSGSGIVEAAFAVLQEPIELRDLNARDGEHHGEAYRRINPLGKMPALVAEDGAVLTETLAILLWLDGKHPGRLLPTQTSPERGEALRLLCVLATEIYPLVELTDHPERFVLGEAEEQLRQRASALTLSRWRMRARQVAGNPYCLESGFSAVDLYAAKLVVWLDRDVCRRELPKLDAMLKATKGRPELREVWARHIPWEL